MPPRLARWRPPATLTSTRQPGTAIVALASGARRAGNLTAARPRHAPSPGAPCPRARRRSIPKSAQSYLSPLTPWPDHPAKTAARARRKPPIMQPQTNLHARQLGSTDEYDGHGAEQ